MPARIRHSPLAAGLSLVDLPILPFLAPRLLQPWPQHLRGWRSQSTSAVPYDSPAAQAFANDDRQRSCDSAARKLHPAQASKAQDSHVHPSDERPGARKSQFEHLHDTRKVVVWPLHCRNDQEEGIGVHKSSTQHLAEDIDSDSLRGHTTTDSTTRGNHRPLFGQTEESWQNHLDIRTATAQGLMRPTHVVARASEEGSVSSSPVAHSPVNGCENDYFCTESYLKPLHQFAKIDLNAKGLKEGRYFGFWWERWFESRRDSKDTKFISEDNRRLVMQLIEAFANFDSEADTSSLRTEWMEIPRRIRHEHWPGLMLDTLTKRPEHALKFLLATCVFPLPHKNLISDTLDYIINYHIYRQNDSPILPEDFEVLFDVIHGMLKEFDRRDVHISEYTIYQLSLHANRAQTEKLYTSLAARGNSMNFYCRLHFVENLARRGATDTAVEVVKGLHRKGADFTEPRMESVCATLLRCSQRDPEAKISESEIFSLLLGYGLRPRINFYNILAHNAFESGDHETAWKVYDMVIANGTEPSNYTYSIFLNDAKQRMDLGAMQHIVGEIKSRGVRNEYIATDLLHTMWKTHEWQLQQIAPQKLGMAWRALWQRMLSMYSTYFETGPLEDLSPEHFAFAPQTAGSGGGKMHPDYPTLALMIRVALRCTVRQSELPPLYRRFRKLVEEGHPDFVNIGRGTYIPNAFIRTMGVSVQTRPFCKQVLADMLDTHHSLVEQNRVDGEYRTSRWRV